MCEEDSGTSATVTEAAPTGTRHRFVASIRIASFWTAVATPFLLVPLLLSGLDSPGKAGAFAILLGVAVVTLLLGHGHRPT